MPARFDRQYDVVVAVTSNVMAANATETWDGALLRKLGSEHSISFDETESWLEPGFAFATFVTLEEGLAHFGAWQQSVDLCPYVGPVVGFIAFSLYGPPHPLPQLLEPVARCALGPVLRIDDRKVFTPVRELTVRIGSMCWHKGTSFDEVQLFREDGAYLRDMQRRVRAVLERAGVEGYCDSDWDDGLRVGLFGADGNVMSERAAEEALGRLEVSLWGFDPSALSDFA